MRYLFAVEDADGLVFVGRSADPIGAAARRNGKILSYTSASRRHLHQLRERLAGAAMRDGRYGCAAIVVDCLRSIAHPETAGAGQ
jgi:hypothetical protein